ncbi:hypothetical protein HY546_03235 [archaeon]|nr:hypothetical protein [archaeon]
MQNKGFALWITSQFNMLFFIAVLVGAFFFYFTLQQDFQGIDFAHRTGENIARLMETVASAPANFSQDLLLPAGISKIEILQQNQEFYLNVSKGRYSIVRYIIVPASVVSLQGMTKIRISKIDGIIFVSPL